MCMHALCLCVKNLNPDRQTRSQNVDSERSPVIVNPPQPVNLKRNTRGRTGKGCAGKFIVVLLASFPGRSQLFSVTC